MKKLLVLIAVTVLMSGCASLFTDDTKNVNVLTSNGKRATLSVDGREFMVPGVINLEKSEDDKILMDNSGNCMPTALQSKVETAFWFNGLAGFSGLFSSTTDYASEAMWTYDDTVFVQCGLDR